MSKWTLRSWIVCALAAVALACGSSKTDEGGSPGGAADVVMDGSTYRVRQVEMLIETGEDPWFRIQGEPSERPEADCVPGLGGTLALYGDLPAGIDAPGDLAGKRLRVDFTGDGDDANLCFVGMAGLAGAEDAWVTIDSVDGDRISFSMSGTFRVYDSNGEGPLERATAKGTARLLDMS